MSPPKLPALRLTAEGECIVEEGLYFDLPSSNKFSVSYASSAGRQNSMLGGINRSTNRTNTHDGEAETQDPIMEEEANSHPHHMRPPLEEKPSAFKSFYPDRQNPQIARTISMPLPSQLSHLQHPHRPGSSDYFQALSPSTSSSSKVREVSIELADSIQLAIQTMLQISPPQVLDPAKEQFSACALSVPTSSMSALFTAMKNVNYLSANMSSFCEDATTFNHPTYNEFDVGEMLQCVGDALSGTAAQSGVDLVIYHGDVGLKHVYVSGDESGISFVLSHIVRQVLSTTERGDSIELGLLVSPISIQVQTKSQTTESPPIDDMLSAAPLESNGPVRITIRISHKYAPSDTHQGVGHPKDVVTTEIRPIPTFSTSLLRRVLRSIGGNLMADLPPPEAFTSGRTCDLEMVLDRVPLPISTHTTNDTNEVATTDPTLEVLSTFGETLKGRQVTLYASARGSFAHHLTSYLTAWGMDVTHVAPDGHIDGLGDPLPTQDDGRSTTYNALSSDPPSTATDKVDQRSAPHNGPSFIIVDDDVDILKNRLQTLRFEYQPPSLLAARKRPPLSSRTRSTSQMTRAMGANNSSRSAPVVILYFTSLANFKLVRDVMQSIAISYTATSTPLPEVMIIPKPAGPRRFLTALHTAVTKPVVDPLFMPIATSPISPGLRDSDGSFFAMSANDQSTNSSINGSLNGVSQTQPSLPKNGPRPRGSRSNSDRSTRSNSDATNPANAAPSSPLAFPENVEYFSTAGQKLGTSPSSGLVIHSPDGQTAGIYFHPRSKNNSRNASSSSMEKGNGQLTLAEAERLGTARASSSNLSRTESENGGMASFASLHEATSPIQKVTRPAPRIGPSPRRSSSSISSQVASSPRVMSAGIVDDPNLRDPLLTTNIVATVPRWKSDTDRHGLGMAGVTMPMEVTSPPARRAVPKRGSDARQAMTAANKKRGKTALSDNNVVPPISVLIVDDNPINQTILSTFMKRKRIKYELASNGQEAVQKWKTGGFHLILMDIQMPVMDGIQATKEIRRIEKCNATSEFPSPSLSIENGQQTPPSTSETTSASETKHLNSPYRSSVIIVALTASSLQSDRVAALAAGCNDFLTKPVSLLWLNNKIIEWGSIKALQMWADIRPEAVKTMHNGQIAQATRVAERLHVPESAKVAPLRRSSFMDDNAAALALASSGPMPNIPDTVETIPPSPTASYFKVTEQSGSRTSPMQVDSPLALEGSINADNLPKLPVKRGSLEPEDDGAILRPHKHRKTYSDPLHTVLDTPKGDAAPAQVHRMRNNSVPSDSKSRSLTPIQARIPVPTTQRRPSGDTELRDTRPPNHTSPSNDCSSRAVALMQSRNMRKAPFP